MKYLSVCSGIEIGQRFGRLIVAEKVISKRRDQWRWRCVCDCGTEVLLRGSRLRSGSTKSCGCLRRDRAGGPYRSHGLSQTAEYCMFYDARKRAVARGLPFSINPEHIVIPAHCPVLGIKLSQEGPRDNRPSLDRIVPERGYTPSNIRVISFRANRIKSDATAYELRAVLEYVESATCDI